MGRWMTPEWQKQGKTPHNTGYVGRDCNQKKYFDCLYCPGQKTVKVELQKRLGIADLRCETCDASWRCTIHYLEEECDVYDRWERACRQAALEDLGIEDDHYDHQGRTAKEAKVAEKIQTGTLSHTKKVLTGKKLDFKKLITQRRPIADDPPTRSSPPIAEDEKILRTTGTKRKSRTDEQTTLQRPAIKKVKTETKTVKKEPAVLTKEEIAKYLVDASSGEDDDGDLEMELELAIAAQAEQERKLAVRAERKRKAAAEEAAMEAEIKNRIEAEVERRVKAEIERRVEANRKAEAERKAEVDMQLEVKRRIAAALAEQEKNEREMTLEQQVEHQKQEFGDPLPTIPEGSVESDDDRSSSSSLTVGAPDDLESLTTDQEGIEAKAEKEEQTIGIETEAFTQSISDNFVALHTGFGLQEETGATIEVKTPDLNWSDDEKVSSSVRRASSSSGDSLFGESD